jgi:hypothetical protein
MLIEGSLSLMDAVGREYGWSFNHDQTLFPILCPEIIQENPKSILPPTAPFTWRI